ncbi:hypothetical protein AMTR_s00039p00077530 [Amborella trichopoda]|uniref:Uncharacterized protein n=1 Tax=Amborella trichopoda TaxID=13333 RepID=U5D2W2_AMBTC|nr:hypothetical protein AMTR_s00039p00077530 [Amborella trichopoda]
MVAVRLEIEALSSCTSSHRHEHIVDNYHTTVGAREFADKGSKWGKELLSGIKDRLEVAWELVGVLGVRWQITKFREREDVKPEIGKGGAIQATEAVSRLSCLAWVSEQAKTTGRPCSSSTQAKVSSWLRWPCAGKGTTSTTTPSLGTS